MRSAKSRIFDDQRRFSTISAIATPYSRAHNSSQEPPSKYASERAFASGGISARYASVAACGSKWAEGWAAGGTGMFAGIDEGGAAKTAKDTRQQNSSTALRITELRGQMPKG